MNLRIPIFAFSMVLIALLISACHEDFIDNADVMQEKGPDSYQRTCFSIEHTKFLMLDEAYRQKREQLMGAFNKINEQRYHKSHCDSPVLVPVAIHYQDVSGPDENCLRQLAIDQINSLNLDFSGHNGDISNWTNHAAAHFPGISNGEMCVQFVIADKNHPEGYGLGDGDFAITVNATQGEQIGDWAGYINVFVRPNIGALGYAPLGGFGDGDGVVIDASGFGEGAGCGSIAPDAPFNLGRTLTHEMGHYLLLDHIWGFGCGADDEVGDTPDQASDYSGCPNVGASSCGSVDMHMNYMDYTDDACMYMFSAGQTSRMSNYLQASLSNITSNSSNVYSGGGDTGGGDTGGGDTGGGDTGGGGDPIVCQSPTSAALL